ncbi:MAG TPA: YbjN domain-containing protein [Chthonomonadaceae bacterium]|nr:YbjN domain-containing protein [Chthonomonadaceae bacterium]
MPGQPDDAEQTWSKRSLRPRRRDSAPPEPGQLYAAMRRFFEEEQWKFHEIEGQSAVRLGCTGENGDWTCVAQIKENPGRFLFYSVLAVRAPAAERSAVAEFIARANYGMVLGNFELDYTDGEIRYKTSAYLEELLPSRELFHTLVYTNLLMTDKYLPGIMSVIYAGMTPDLAMARVGG